jgi:hypothetical protein
MEVLTSIFAERVRDRLVPLGFKKDQAVVRYSFQPNIGEYLVNFYAVLTTQLATYNIKNISLYSLTTKNYKE